MPTLRQKLRQVERAAARVTGDRRQAAGLRIKLDRHLQQLAAGHARSTGRRVSTSHEPQVYERFVRSGKADWVNVPGQSNAVLVERGTGCVLVDSRGGLILRSRRMLPSKPAINKGDFIKYLRRQGIEEYVPHMYLDDKNNVTVGIGHLIPDVDKAKGLSFTKRGTTLGASHSEIALAFNTVKSSGLTNATAPAFRNLTNIFMTEADAVSQAMKDIDEFLNILKSSDYFPEFDSYPMLAKEGLLDLAYNVGADGARFGYKKTAAAALRRNWKQAGIEQRDGRKAFRVNIVQGWFNQAAQQEPFFISHTNCQKTLASLAK